MECLGLGISVKIHEVINSVGKECAVGVSGDTQIVGNREMVSGAVTVG
jgi:hypothetical protein